MSIPSGRTFNGTPPIISLRAMEDNPITDFTSASHRRSGDGRVKLNVGGKIFSTAASTIRSHCPDSLLAAIADGAGSNPVFIDRDPEIFSVLLSLLRSDSLPSAAFKLFSLRELVDEAQYYGIESVLRSAISPPPFNGIDASVTTTICPAADGFASDFTTKDSSLWVAHGGQISTYDWNLSHTGTIRTHVDDITRICSVWDETAAIGSESSAGLHFYDLSGGRLLGTTHWTDPSDPRIYKARAAAIVDTPSTIYASFDCPHRENAVLQVDKSTLQISNVVCRQPGSSTKYTVPEKLRWLPEKGLLIGSSVTCGAFGYAGYVRIWDPRSGDVVWETSEPGSGRSSRYGDSLADVDVDTEDSVLFKVCSKSGDVGMADLRKLGEDPWIYLSDENPSMWNDKGGNYNILHCYRKQVFVGRGGELEVWSRVKTKENGGLIDEGLYRRNFVDKLEDSKRGAITKIEGGSDRLFVSRENVEGIEVWESSNSSAAIAVV